MSDPQLCRRVEEASLNAWPAFQQSLYDGWVLRFSRGFTKRANSIVPLYPAQQSPLEKVRYCENLYARERLKTIFRLTTVIDSDPLDAMLARRDYQRVDPTCVLARELTATRFPTTPHFREISRDRWLDAYAQATDMPDAGRRLHATLLAGICTPHVFGAIIAHGTPVAWGLAVIEAELVGLFDIVTHPEARRLGHARALVTSLIDWGQRGGARHAYLQVIESNQPARALYAQLGFENLYDYWYRIEP